MTKLQSTPRLLFFFHTNQLGGAEKSVIDIILNLRQKGYATQVILPSNGSLTDICKELDIPTHVVDYYWWCSADKTSKITQWQWLLKSFFSVLYFRFRYPQYIPDVVITNTVTIPWGMLYSRLTHRPHISLLREFGTLDFGFDFLLGYKRSLQIIEKYSDYVFTNSLTTKKHFTEFMPTQKIGYFYPNIDTDSSALVHPRKKYFSKDTLKLLNLGTINESKGQLDAVKATLILLENGYTQVELILAGNKSSNHYYHILREAIKLLPEATDRITIHDFIVNQEEIINEADIVLVCSKNEAFGRITAESMSIGKAIIATKSGANQELLEDGITALFYTPGKEMDLAEKIEILHNDKKLRSTLGTAAYESFTTKLQPKMSLEPLYQAIEDLMKLK